MKTKKIPYLLVLSLVLLLSSIILFACNSTDETREYKANSNGKVVNETLNGEEIYRAVPDDWYEFEGWYEGNRKYSENPILKIRNSTPTTLEARFATSAKSTTDRHLNSFYNTYVEGENKDGDYFNYSLSSEMNYTQGQYSLNKDVSLNGYIDFDSSSQLAFEVKDSSNTDFAFYYINDSENATIYIQIEDEKYSYTDMGLLTNIFKFLPISPDSAWKLDDLIEDENTRYLINQYFGIKNSMGFINSVENSENTSKITIRYSKILNLLKNIANNSPSASSLQTLIHALTCEYEFSTLPEMILSITTDFETILEREQIKNIKLEFNLNSDYVVNFNGDKYTLPAMDIVLNITNINFGFSNEANAISNEVISSFPEPSVNMINVHADGILDFINATETTPILVDRYIIQLDADLNPLALVSFNKDREGNYHDIDWEKLGFLSFKISLIPETDATELQKQKERHNGVYDYINILIDTKNNGAKVYLFVGLYTPNTIFTQNYIFNHSFDIPSLLDMADKNDDTSNAITNILMKLISGSLAIKTEADLNNYLNQILNDFLTNLNLNETLVNECITTTENGFELDLAPIRTEIRNFEKNTLQQMLGVSTEIKFDKKIFGDDEKDKINKISLSMERVSLSTVKRNQDGEYLNEEGELFIDIFNNAHKVLVAVDPQTGISELNTPKSLQDLQDLKGSVITLAQGILSDGTTTTTQINNKGREKEIKMIVEDILIISQNGNTAKIRVLLQFKDFPNSFSSIPMIGEEIYKLTGIPYGLIAYETTIELN